MEIKKLCRRCVYFCEIELYDEYEEKLDIVECCTHFDNRIIKPSYRGYEFVGRFKRHPCFINENNNCKNYIQLSDECMKSYTFLFNF